jgi:hypothetical protein
MSEFEPRTNLIQQISEVGWSRLVGTEVVNPNGDRYVIQGPITGGIPSNVYSEGQWYPVANAYPNLIQDFCGDLGWLREENLFYLFVIPAGDREEDEKLTEEQHQAQQRPQFTKRGGNGYTNNNNNNDTLATNQFAAAGNSNQAQIAAVLSSSNFVWQSAQPPSILVEIYFLCVSQTFRRRGLGCLFVRLFQQLVLREVRKQQAALQLQVESVRFGVESVFRYHRYSSHASIAANSSNASSTANNIAVLGGTSPPAQNVWTIEDNPSLWFWYSIGFQPVAVALGSVYMIQDYPLYNNGGVPLPSYSNCLSSSNTGDANSGQSSQQRLMQLIAQIDQLANGEFIEISDNSNSNTTNNNNNSINTNNNINNNNVHNNIGQPRQNTYSAASARPRLLDYTPGRNNKME